MSGGTERDTGTDLAYLIVFGLAAVAVTRIWSTRVGPWAEENIAAVRDSGVVADLGGWSVTTADLVGVALILVPVLLGLVVVRAIVRRRRRRATAFSSAAG